MKNWRKNSLIPLLIFIILFPAMGVFAQSPESISLRIWVRDQNNDPIPEALIQIRNPDGRLLFEKSVSNGFLEIRLIKSSSFDVRIESKGFKPFQLNYEASGEAIEIRAKLEINPVKESVTVDLSEREKKFLDSVNRVLTQEEIDRLPESPQALEQELRKKYGDDVIFRVDGFTGGKFPSRSQISSITVTVSPIDAEFREVGKTLVDIRTKVIPQNNWRGSIDFSLQDYHFDARNAFYPKKAESNAQQFSLYIAPPSIGKNSSLHFNFQGTRSDSTRLFFPTSILDNGASRRETETIAAPSISWKRNLNSSHVLQGMYFLTFGAARNAGLGTLDLSERAISKNSRNSELRFIENGVLFKNYSNQARFRWINNRNSLKPNSNQFARLVLGEFYAGGATVNFDNVGNTLEFAELFSFGKDKYFLKIGAEFNYESVDFHDATNTNGTFIFSDILTYIDSRPILFERKTGISNFTYTNSEAVAFIQGYFYTSKFLQVGAGIRWEYQSVFNNFTRFAPRLSFVWSPEKSGKLIFRGGYGRILLNLGASFFGPVLSNSESQPPLDRILFPDYPNASGNETRPPPSITRVDKFENPASDFVMFVGMWDISKSLKVAGGGSIGRGTHYPRIRDTNPLINGVRSDPNFDVIKLYEFAGNDTASTFLFDITYSQLNIELKGTYSFNHEITDFMPDELPTDNSVIRNDIGPVDTVRTHTIEFSAEFSLGRVVKFKPLRQLQVNIASSILSGLPYNVTTGFDDNQDGVINDRPLGVARNSARGEWHYQTNLNLAWNPKIFDKSSQRRLTFYTTVENLFNHVNEANYIGVKSSPNFGKPTASLPSRSMKFGISYSF